MKQLLWEGITQHSLEYCRVFSGDTIRVMSSLVTCSDGQPFSLEYSIVLANDWAVRSFSLHCKPGTIDHSLAFETDGHGNWMYNGKPVEHLRGCSDIDISATPLTNTLPVKRLALSPGETKEIDVLYVDVPSCQVRKERQRYTRLADGRYRFRNADGSFTADIQTDEDGFVKFYPGLFRNISNNVTPGM